MEGVFLCFILFTNLDYNVNSDAEIFPNLINSYNVPLSHVVEF